MPRDYTKQSDSRLWTLAEEAFGVGHGNVDIKTHENEGASLPWEACLSPEPQPDIGPRRGAPSELTARGKTEEEAIEAVFGRLRDDKIREAVTDLLHSLPSEAASALKKYAVLLLEVENNVHLYGKNSTLQESAHAVGQYEYRGSVEGAVGGILSDIKSGHITTRDQLYEAIQGNDITHTSEALDTLRYSNNDEAYWEQMGGEPPSWTEFATYAFQEDIKESLEKEGVDLNYVEVESCVRCGDVTVTDKDAEDCPKCGLVLSAVEREGVKLPEGDSHIEVCEDCHHFGDVAGEPIGPANEFECARCGDTCLTAKTPPEPEPERAERVGYTCAFVDDTGESDVCAECLNTDVHLNPAEIDPGSLFECCVCKGAFKAPRAEENHE